MQSRRFATLLLVFGLVALTVGLFSARPEQASAQHVASISLGGQHSCAVTTAGGVQCWGRNQAGILGNGTTEDSSVPVDVVGLQSGVTMVDLGAIHSCAVTDAGGVKCWGVIVSEDGSGFEESFTPVDVLGLDSTVVAVQGGFRHSCALTTSRTVKCWGSNWYGELGDGTNAYSATPVDVLEEPGGAPLSGVVAISIGGGFYTCALTTEGGVKCWGRNDTGQLGDGTPTDRSSPVDVVGLSDGVAALSVGEQHACALMTDGGIKCWGWNLEGALGDGQSCANYCPAPVDVVGLASGVTAVSSGGAHTCAVLTAGGIKCWGNNFFGQVSGVGGFGGADVLIPEDVVGLNNKVLAVSAGGIHTCALVETGAVTCWGSDGYGQIGDADGDGCTDFSEHGSDPVVGGLRDHENYWDFGDQWIGGTRDKTIVVGDIGAVVARFGSSRGSSPSAEEALAEATTPPNDTTSYHASADRSAVIGANLWDVGPPDGSIVVGDIGAVVAQFGHACA